LREKAEGKVWEKKGFIVYEGAQQIFSVAPKGDIFMEAGESLSGPLGQGPWAAA